MNDTNDTDTSSPPLTLTLPALDTLLRTNFRALQSSDASYHVRREEQIDQLVTLAIEMAHRGLRIAHQRSWSQGAAVGPLDAADCRFKLGNLQARDFRWIVCDNGRPSEVYAGLLLIPWKARTEPPEMPHGEGTKRQVEKRALNWRKWARPIVAQRILQTDPWRCLWSPVGGGVVVVMKTLQDFDDWPQPSEVPEGAEQLEAELREMFVSGRSIELDQRPEWLR